MTVQELIKELEKYDRDLLVVIDNGECTVIIDEVEIQRVDMWYDKIVLR